MGPTTSLVSRSSSNELAPDETGSLRPLPLRHPSYHSIRTLTTTGSSSSNNTSRCYQSIDRSYSFNEADHRRASVRWNEASISRQSSTASHHRRGMSTRPRRRRLSLQDPTKDFDDDDEDDINEINQLSSVDSDRGPPAAGGLMLQKSMSSGATQGAQSWKKLRAVMAYYCSLRKIKRNGSKCYLLYTLLFSMYFYFLILF